MKFSEGVNERALTMAKLMIKYYQQVENDYEANIGNGDAFNHANSMNKRTKRNNSSQF
jgi:hypothetical protein